MMASLSTESKKINGIVVFFIIISRHSSLRCVSYAFSRLKPILRLRNAKMLRLTARIRIKLPNRRLPTARRTRGMVLRTIISNEIHANNSDYLKNDAR